MSQRKSLHLLFGFCSSLTRSKYQSDMIHQCANFSSCTSLLIFLRHRCVISHVLIMFSVGLKDIACLLSLQAFWNYLMRAPNHLLFRQNNTQVPYKGARLSTPKSILIRSRVSLRSNFMQMFSKPPITFFSRCTAVCISSSHDWNTRLFHDSYSGDPILLEKDLLVS